MTIHLSFSQIPHLAATSHHLTIFQANPFEPQLCCAYIWGKQRAWSRFPDTEVRNYTNTLNCPPVCPIFPSCNIHSRISHFCLFKRLICSSPQADCNRGASSSANYILKAACLILMAEIQILLGRQRLNPRLESLYCKYAQTLPNLFPSPCLQFWTVQFTHCSFSSWEPSPEWISED